MQKNEILAPHDAGTDAFGRDILIFCRGRSVVDAVVTSIHKNMQMPHLVLRPDDKTSRSARHSLAVHQLDPCRITEASVLKGYGKSAVTAAGIGGSSRGQPAAISGDVSETHLLYLDCSQTSEPKGLSRKMIFHLSEIQSIHYAEYFRSRGHQMTLKRSRGLLRRPADVNQTRNVPGGRLFSPNLSASSSGSDKKRSHFPLKINKTAAPSEHAQKSSQRTRLAAATV